MVDSGAKAKWPDPLKAPSWAEYGQWLEAIHSVDVKKERVKYESAQPKIAAAASAADFWTEFQSQRTDISESYFGETRYKLFAFDRDSDPTVKSWDSFFLKTFRRNVLNNERFPNPPANGWLLPRNWLQDVHDIVRTSLVVKYLDGVKFAIEALRAIGTLTSTPFEFDLQARDTGYYAAHTYASFAVDLPDDEWRHVRHDLKLEIQITTQLQEVIGRLTHHQYEKRRVLPTHADKGWQWDHSSEAFQPNYLGHLLHYAEGMIMEVRNRELAE